MATIDPPFVDSGSISTADGRLSYHKRSFSQQQQRFVSNPLHQEKSLRLGFSSTPAPVGPFRVDDAYMCNLNAALLPTDRDYSLFEALSYEVMLATTKDYACTIMTMLRFMEVNNPSRSKYEGLAKELETVRDNAAVALVESEKKRQSAEVAAVKVDSKRLKTEDKLKNKEQVLRSSLVVLGKANEELKAAREAHDKILRELSQARESCERVS